MRKRSIASLTVLLLVSALVFTSFMVHASFGKLVGSISITASPTTIKIGQTTTISGKILNPTDVNETVNQTVTIWYRLSGKPWSILASVTTNETRQYSYDWKPTTHGIYELKATWIGETYAAESSRITVDVNAPPTASFTYTPDTPTVGDTVTFNASASYDPDGTIVSYDWDFGDGATGTGVTTTHAYSAVGTYTITLNVTDNDTLTDTESRSIRVRKPPVASFTYSPTAPLVGDTVTFDASGSSDIDGTIVSYVWDFGDGKTGTGKTTTHAYTSAGTYTVTLTVTDNDTLTDTETKPITVSELESPVASFTYSPPAPTTGETVTFNASASDDPDGTIISYFWDFGDGANATGITVDHAYADNGTYPVTLTVTDDDGLTDTTSKDITVLNISPNATFTESAETVYTAEVITFNASDSYDPDGNVTSYFWDFGDGTNATGMIVEHSYADDGNYTVTLTVTDDDGVTHSTTANKTVLNRPPVAVFTESAEIVYINETIYLNASDSYDPDGSIVSYWWDFGDGTNATGMTTEHSYSLEGNYTVTLALTDDDGATNSTSATKTIRNRPPIAVFTESAEKVYTNETIYFNASESYDSDGLVVSYSWDFGDGTNATGVVVEHAYIDDGNYTVILTVMDDDGATGTATATKTVLNRPPVAIFTESTEVAYVGETISFNASDSYDLDGTIASYFWDFGDGANATGITIDHAYADDGVYTVALTVTDDEGATGTAKSAKTVLNRPPVASFTESAETVYPGETITFNASASYDPDGLIVRYLWDFGDGTNAMGVTADHAYTDDGVYTLTLTLTDNDGETALKSAVKTVSNRPPIAVFTENATIVDIEEAIRFDASDSYDPDGSIISYFWDFGDRTNATMAVILDHAYTKDGNYTVTLTVTDDDGASSSVSTTISVKASLGWPLALIAGIALGIAAVNGTVFYATYNRRRKKSAN